MGNIRSCQKLVDVVNPALRSQINLVQGQVDSAVAAEQQCQTNVVFEQALKANCDLETAACELLETCITDRGTVAADLLQAEAKLTYLKGAILVYEEYNSTSGTFLGVPSNLSGSVVLKPTARVIPVDHVFKIRAGDPALPAGLLLDPLDGSITGLPTGAATPDTQYRVTLFDDPVLELPENEFLYVMVTFSTNAGGPAPSMAWDTTGPAVIPSTVAQTFGPFQTLTLTKGLTDPPLELAVRATSAASSAFYPASATTGSAGTPSMDFYVDFAPGWRMKILLEQSFPAMTAVITATLQQESLPAIYVDVEPPVTLPTYLPIYDAYTTPTDLDIIYDDGDPLNIGVRFVLRTPPGDPSGSMTVVLDAVTMFPTTFSVSTVIAAVPTAVNVGLRTQEVAQVTLSSIVPDVVTWASNVNLWTMRPQSVLAPAVGTPVEFTMTRDAIEADTLIYKLNVSSPGSSDFFTAAGFPSLLKFTFFYRDISASPSFYFCEVILSVDPGNVGAESTMTLNYFQDGGTPTLISTTSVSVAGPAYTNPATPIILQVDNTSLSPVYSFLGVPTFQLDSATLSPPFFGMALPEPNHVDIVVETNGFEADTTITQAA